ncbi:MAG: wax ester/triacylglycerol synthase family O-acyltransferase [Betaproteobacteria bacterium]
MSGLDGTFLHLETPATPMHVGSLHLIDLPAGHEGDFHADVMALIAARLHQVPVFRRRLAPMTLQFANPVWVEDAGVDLAAHVRRVRLPRPGTQAQLEACVADLHAETLDRGRPLWMIYVIDGLARGQAACYLKIHHAVLDGAAGVALARTLFDVAPGNRPDARGVPSAKRGNALPGALRLAAAALTHDAAQYVKLLRHLPDVARTVAGLVRAPDTRPAAGKERASTFAPKTPLNATITAARSYAAVSLPLDGVKALAARHDATVNDVVLALCGGVLRRYLARHGGIPEKPLRAFMPISLRDAGNAEFTTKATLGLVGLATNVADPVRRLIAVRNAASAVKSVARRARGVIPTDFPSIGTPWLFGALASLYGRSGLADALPPLANVVISNVPGSPVPLYVAGARMRTYWPLSIVEHGVGLNITVMSYAGDLGFGFTAARCAVGDAGELVADLIDAHDELQRRSAARRTTARATTARTPAARGSRTRDGVRK